MRKSGALFLTRGMICLFFWIFLFAAAFVSRNLKDQTPAAIEVYDIRGLDVSMAQAEPLSKGEAFAAAGMGELAQAAGEAEDSFVFAYYQVTTPNYGACANLHFCEGEYFSADASVSLEAVIPESLAKKLLQKEV